MFNLAVWNIRGLNLGLKQTEVKKLIAKYKLSILGLVETHGAVRSVNKDWIFHSICPTG